MDLLTRVLTVAAIGTAVLIVALAARPGSIERRAGKILALVAFAVLPLSITGIGARTHLEHAKATAFCLSCHEMTPYGRSLWVDDAEALPASHVQNRRVPVDQACYACHTTYTMYGDFEAKLKGLRHVWVHYFGEVPETIALYQPFHNRECLYCHAGARSFEENELHAEERSALDSDEVSCLECHDVSHDLAGLDDADFWHPPDGERP